MSESLKLRIRYKDANAPKITLDVQELIIESDLDLARGKAKVSFVIKDDQAFNADLYEFNETAQHGKIKAEMDIADLVIKSEDGSLNLEKINGMLQAFNPNIEVDIDYYSQQIPQ